MSEIPIACVPTALSIEERAVHVALSIDTIARWPARREELPDGYLFEYQGDEQRFLALARWVAGEHRCCPWASYSVAMEPFVAPATGTIRLRVTTSAEGAAFLKTCYQHAETLAGREAV